MTIERLLVCGLGSAGQRHLRCFRAAGVARIDAYRTGLGSLEVAADSAPDRTFDDLDAALAERPQAVVIANPSALHARVARAALDAGADLLVEKPLAVDPGDARELAARAGAAGRIVAVGCNLRFHPLLVELRDRLAAGVFGRPVLARAHFGAWLPGWHPWEDYRTGYAARAELGGGARLTHIHEIDYLSWLLGPVATARGDSAGLAPLGTDVDEVSALLLRHQSGALSLASLSLCERPPSRLLEVSCEAGRYQLDLAAGQLRALPADGEPELVTPPAGWQIADTYQEQARAFVTAIERGELGDELCGADEAALAVAVALAKGADA